MDHSKRSPTSISTLHYIHVYNVSHPPFRHMKYIWNASNGNRWIIESDLPHAFQHNTMYMYILSAQWKYFIHIMSIQVYVTGIDTEEDTIQKWQYENFKRIFITKYCVILILIHYMLRICCAKYHSFGYNRMIRII